MKLIIDDTKVDVVIVRKRIKNLYFRFKEDMKLYVSCNVICSDSYIEKILIKNKKDIIKMYNNMKDKVKDNDGIYYLGNKLEFINSKNIFIDEDYAYGPSIEDINKYLEKISIDIFSKRLESIKVLFKNLPEFRLRTRKMKTRWGVCNKSSMTVTLNTELIHKDVTLIDYVIVHELCHFKYMDHSANFWREVEKYYPYYKLARNRLK